MWNHKPFNIQILIFQQPGIIFLKKERVVTENPMADLTMSERPGREPSDMAMVEAQEYAESIVDTVREPLVVLDADLRVVSANRSFYKTFKVESGETIGQHLYDLGNRQWDIPPLRDLLEKILPMNTTIENFEVRHDFPSIGGRIMVLNARRLYREPDRTQMILLAIEDITERKLAQEALQKAHEELEIRVMERTAELVQANEQLRKEIQEREKAEKALQESSEKIKFFAYSVSHDLKNPALGIHGLAKLLYRQYKEILDEKGKNFCEKILRASEQIAALTERINLYISTKETPLTIESVRLTEVLQMVREEFSAELNIRQIKWLQSDPMPEIMADRLSLLRVLRNLVDNALKYGGEDLSEIEIGYRESDGHHILSVRDNGIGLEKEDCDKIFEPYERKGASRGIEGAGLGLAIVKEIAERHGGRAWSESGPGKGAVFYVSISKWLNPHQ
jgi:PAS domain S-box-containing protein